MKDINIKSKPTIILSIIYACILLHIPNIINSQNILKESGPHLIKSDGLFDLLSKAERYSKYDYNGSKKKRKDYAYNDEIRRYIISDSLENKIWCCDTIYVLSTYTKPLYLYRCIECSYWMVITKNDKIGYVEYLTEISKGNNNNYASTFLQKRGLDKFLKEVSIADAVKCPQKIWYRLGVFIRKDDSFFYYTQFELYFPVPSVFLHNSTDYFNLINDEVDVSNYF